MKRILIKLFAPPNSVIYVVDIITIPLLVISLSVLPSTNPVSLFSYLLSTYALIISIVGIKRLVKHINYLLQNDKVYFVVCIKRIMHKNKYTGLYIDSKDFRARISLYFGLAVNLLFAVFKGATGIYYKSAWLCSIGIYYFFLGAVKFMLMKNVRITSDDDFSSKGKYHEYKTYRLCGNMIMALDLAIAVMTIQMIWADSTVSFSQTAVIISAAYTFYSFISAAANVVSFRKRNNAILSAAKNVNMTAAVMAMYSLQNSMLFVFEKDGQQNFRKLMNSITGGFVLVIVLGIASYMIINGTKKMKYYSDIMKNG